MSLHAQGNDSFVYYNDASDPEYDFYNSLRDAIIALTFFCILYGISHYILQKFLNRSGDDRVAIPLVLCAICLSISLGALLLMPITILSNEIILNFPNNYYTRWLHRELIFMLWNCIFWLANLAMFVILPFSYFFYEAEGLGGKGLLARIFEAVVVLSLVFIILGVVVYVVHALYDGSSVRFVDLPFTYSLLSGAGAFLVLVSTPRGFTNFSTYGFSLYLPYVTRKRMNAKISALDIEEQVLTSKLVEFDDNDYERQQLITRSNQVRSERSVLSRGLSLPPLVRNMLSLGFVTMNIAFAGFTILSVLIRLLERYIYSLFSDTSSNLKLSDFLALQNEASSRLGYFVSLLQVAGLLYMMTAAFVGFYDLPWTQHFKPKKNNTSMGKLVVNMAFILLISSSFPVIARILEITSFDLLGSYSQTNYVRNIKFQYLYKIVFIFALVHRYTTFFGRSLKDSGILEIFNFKLTRKSINPNVFAYYNYGSPSKKEV